jgi:hypothetical protein
VELTCRTRDRRPEEKVCAAISTGR